MAVDIKHSCGHSEPHHLLSSNAAERDRKAAWLKRQPCRACQRVAEQAAATETEQALGLAPLTGTPKQVAWAMTIRAKMVDELADMRGKLIANAKRQIEAGKLSPEQMAIEMQKLTQYEATILGQTDASWWIDHRSASAADLLRQARAQA